MSVGQNVASIRRLIDVGFSQGDLSVVDELVSPDCVEHQRGSQPGAQGLKDTIMTLRGWCSDFQLTIEDLVAEGDMVWIRNRARGTNNGSIMGQPPTGRSIDIDVIDIARFENGKLIEHWGVPDQLGLMEQLGLVPGREPREVATGAASSRP